MPRRAANPCKGSGPAPRLCQQRRQPAIATISGIPFIVACQSQEHKENIKAVEAWTQGWLNENLKN